MPLITPPDSVSNMQNRSVFSYAPLTDNVLRLIFIFVLAFLFQTVAGLFTTVDIQHLVLRFDGEFHPLQLITHVFTMGPVNFISALIQLFFECLVLWMFGSELERNWGSHNLLKLFYLGTFGAILGGALTSLFFPIYIYGFSGGLAAMLVAYAMIWPDRQALLFFVLPIRMKWLVLIVFIMLIIQDLRVQLAMQLGGGLAAALFVYYYARKGRKTRESVLAGGSGDRSPGPVEKIKEHFRKRRLQKKQEEINRRVDMKAEVDRLLEKISQEGIESLSRKERKFLDESSREF